MLRLPRNVWLLTIAQALVFSVNSSVVFIGGLVGKSLAPDPGLSTLPVACLVIGTAISTIPVTLLMKRIGRRASFLIILTYSVIVALIAMFTVIQGLFIWFCISVFMFGVTSACAMQFRFAAMESVPETLIPNAASNVLIGGIAAAFLGPEIALLGRHLLDVEYSGSFLLLGLIFFLCLGVLIPFRNPKMEITTVDNPQRSLREIAKNPVFWVAILSATVGYAVMSFIMTATPVSMHVIDQHSLESTKWVIQSHILAMFVPSLIAGWVISKLGVSRMMIIGLFAYLLCIAIAFLSHDLENYWVSLVLLGIGWNFLFIGGTTLLPQAYRASERFKVQAVNEFIIFGVQAIASLSAGWVIFSLGWDTLLLITLPIILFQLFIVIKWTSMKRFAVR